MTTEKTSTDFPFSGDEEETKYEMVNKVFELELLREMILDYIIHDKKDVLIPNIRSCRLVNKAWLRSISRILLKCRQPLFRFSLDSGNSTSARPWWSDKPTDEKLLDQFMKSTKEALRLDQRTAPHSIKANWTFFQENNLENLFECFVNCGSSLINLDMQVPESQQPTLLNTDILLSKLRTLRLCVESEEDGDNVNVDNKIGFLHSVFNSCENLESFVLASTCYHDNHVLNSWKNLTFPSTLTELVLNCLLDDCKLKVLADSCLPKLKTLTLAFKRKPFRNGLITSILQNVRKTLQSFSTVYIFTYSRRGMWRRTTRTRFQLPLMEKLEKLEMDNVFLELDGNTSCLQQSVPMLKHMTLCQQTISMFKKWADQSYFQSVNSIKISLVNRRHSGGFVDLGKHVNFDHATWPILINAFPYLQELDIAFCGFRLPGLLLLMKTMNNLKRLCLRIHLGDSFLSPNIYDALLIGVPAEQDDLITRLRSHPDEWDDLQFPDTPSIRNLTNLQKLELRSDDFRAIYSLISDAAFRLAFFKMPKLTNLILEGYFFPTAKMAEMWRNEGRNLEAAYIEVDSDREDLYYREGYYMIDTQLPEARV